MRHLAFVLCTLAVVGLGGVAWAADYGDEATGNWDTPATWGAAGYPGAGDTATIDTYTVTFNSTPFPALSTLTIDGTGDLYMTTESALSISSPIVLNGGKFRQNRHTAVTVDGAISVGGEVTVEASLNQSMAWNGALTSTDPSAKIVKVGGAYYGGGLVVNAASPAYAGQWQILQGFVAPTVDGAMGTGTITIGGPGVIYTAGWDPSGFGPVTGAYVEPRVATMSGTRGDIVLGEHGYLYFTNDNAPGVSDWTVSSTNGAKIVMDGGTITGYHGTSLTISDEISVLSGGKIQLGYLRCDINGGISGSSGLLALGSGQNHTVINSATTYSGDVDVTGNLVLNHAEALSGAGTITIQNGGMLRPVVTPTGTAPAAVVVKAGGTYGGDNYGPYPTLVATDWTITLDGGQYFDKMGFVPTIANPFILTANGGTIAKTYGSLTVTGAVTGDGPLTLSCGNNGGRITMANDTNDYTGGTLIKDCGNNARIEIAAEGAMGAGTATVQAGGILRSNPTGGDTEAVLAGLPIDVQAGGVFQLNSTETDADITVRAGGAFAVLGGNTALTYGTTTGMIHLYTNAILDLALDGSSPQKALPLDTDIIGGGPIWKGAGGAIPAGTYTVGGGTTAVRGLAAMGISSVGNSVIMSEDAVGVGFGLYAGPANSMRIQGVQTLCDAGSILTLEGPGNFYMDTSSAGAGNPTFAGDVKTINLIGGGTLSGVGASQLNKDQTLNLVDGYFMSFRYDWFGGNANEAVFGESDAQADFATVNIKDGAMLYENSDPWTPAGLTRGNIHVEAGGCVVATSNASITGGAAWDFQAGSNLALQDRPAITEASILSSGNPNFVVVAPTAWDQQPTKLGDAGTNNNLYLSNNNSLVGGVNGAVADGGEIVPFDGATIGKITAGNNTAFYVDNKINFPSNTLAIGSDSVIRLFNTRDSGAYVDAVQDGIVVLRNSSNVIRDINVRAGTLMIDSADPLGGAATVKVDAGATFRIDWNNPDLATIIGGTGNVLVGDNGSGTSSLALMPSGGQAAGISPGDSAGTLNVTGNLTLSNDGLDYATLDIEVVSAAACDQVAVTGNLSVGGGNLAVTMDVPSVNYKPADLTGLDIATCGGTLDTTPFNAIAAGVFDSVSTSPSVRAAVAAHWTIEAADVTYDDAGGKIVLDGSNWTGFSGDADLDDYVDLGDLSVLAFNWDESTGMTWLTADFDLSGTVDLADLSVLAFHWDQAPPAGAPPVPEPMTVGLLLVGGVALLRRRRR